MKSCSRCHEIKQLSEFPPSQSAKDGHRAMCRDCFNAWSREWSRKNRDKCKARTKKWRSANREHIRAYTRERYRKNPRKVYDAIEKWRKDHPERVREWNNRKMARLRKVPKNGIDMRMHCAIWKAVKYNKAGKSWESLVGYTVVHLMRHLEKQFIPGMTWENMGEWHIDHIIPVSAFHYERPEDLDFKRCWALKNLRPLWAKDNFKKGSKVDKPFQPSLAISI